jgi:hypothetical protein
VLFNRIDFRSSETLKRNRDMNGFRLAIWAASGALLLTGVLSSARAAATEEGGKVVLKAYQVRTVNEAGKAREQLQTLDGIRPGDTIEYEAVYQGAAQASRNVQVTVPVPAGGLQYVAPAAPANAAVPGLSASTDGKTFQPVPLTAKVTLADGRVEQRAVPTSEYRFLRWSLGDLPAGATRSVRARMQMPALADPQVAATR